MVVCVRMWYLLATRSLISVLTTLLALSLLLCNMSSSGCGFNNYSSNKWMGVALITRVVSGCGFSNKSGKEWVWFQKLW